MYHLKSVSLSAVFVAFCILPTAAEANNHWFQPHSISYSNVYSANSHYRNGQSYGGPSHSNNSAPLTTVTCGQVISSSITVANDLNCPGTTGFALIVAGDSITVNGNGHSISAPLANSGLYVHGNNVTITGFKVHGITQGSGILAFDAPGVRIQSNDFSANEIGIVLFAESTEMSNTMVLQNRANNSLLFGFESSLDEQGIMDAPLLMGNDFSNSGACGMYITASSFELTDQNINNVAGSQNGVYLRGGNFYIHDLHMKQMQIPATEIFVDTAPSVIVSNVDLSNAFSHASTDSQIGLDLLRCGQFQITNLTANGNDVGLKLETESGYATTGTVQCSTFSNNYTAAVMASSYDATVYGNILLASNSYQEPSYSQVFFATPGVATATVNNSVRCYGHSSGGGSSCGNH
jgi:hypothetical protein